MVTMCLFIRKVNDNPHVSQNTDPSEIISNGLEQGEINGPGVVYTRLSSIT